MNFNRQTSILMNMIEIFRVEIYIASKRACY